jgi:hypothetical protein
MADDSVLRTPKSRRRRSVAPLLGRVLKIVMKAGVVDARIRAEVDGEIAEITLGKPDEPAAEPADLKSQL